MPDKNVTINLDYDIVEQEAKAILDCSENIERVQANILAITGNIQRDWRSDASDAYIERMNAAADTVFPAMIGVCEEMSSLLDSAAKTMKAADGSAADAVRTALQEAIDSVFGN